MKTALGHRQAGHEVQHRSSPPKRDTVNKSSSRDTVQPVHGPTESPGAGVTRGFIALGTPLDVGDASRDDPTAKTPVVRAMSTAAKGIVDAMAHSERTGAPDFRSDAQVTGELLHRARWSCILLFEREFVGDDSCAGREIQLDPWHTLLGSSATHMDGVDGVWRILTGQTPMGAEPLDWPFTLSRWLIAPLLCDAPAVSHSELTRMFRRGGLDRKSADRYAEMAISDDREGELRLGTALWAELRRSQFMHPVRLPPFANLIVDGTRRVRRLLMAEGPAVLD